MGGHSDPVLESGFVGLASQRFPQESVTFKEQLENVAFRKIVAERVMT